MFLDQYYLVSLRSLYCVASGSWSPKQCQAWVPSNEMDLRTNQLLVDYSHKLCATNDLHILHVVCHFS